MSSKLLASQLDDAPDDPVQDLYRLLQVGVALNLRIRHLWAALDLLTVTSDARVAEREHTPHAPIQEAVS